MPEPFRPSGCSAQVAHRLLTSNVKNSPANASRKPHPWQRLNFCLHERGIGHSERIAVDRGAGRSPQGLSPQLRMNVIDSRLKPHRPNGRHAQQFDPLLEAKVATIDSPAIELGEPVAVDRIIEEECKIREQVQPIVLAVRVRKKLPT